MFTGIIEETGSLVSRKYSNNRHWLHISCQKVLPGLKVGDSIAVNGICLTATQLNPNGFTAEMMHETALKTTATTWQKGAMLNLERAMPADGRFDGHIVQGHVDTVLTLLSVQQENATRYLNFGMDAAQQNLIVPQGSVAVNRVSLTVARTQGLSFAVALIGHTAGLTNLHQLTPGHQANIEFDIIGKYVARMMQAGSKLTQEYLLEHGF